MASAKLTDDLIVGDDGCDFNTVLTVMSTSCVFHKVDWFSIATSLGLPPLTKDEIKKIQSPLEAVERLLMEWRSHASQNARLSYLITAIQNNGQNDVADKLIHEFSPNQFENQETDELEDVQCSDSVVLRNECIEMIEMPYREVSEEIKPFLQELQGTLSHDEYESQDSHNNNITVKIQENIDEGSCLGRNKCKIFWIIVVIVAVIVVSTGVYMVFD